MQKSIWCTIITPTLQREGIMFNSNQDFTFDDLIKWVLKNCPGNLDVKIIPNKEIQVNYDSRTEIYYMKDIVKCKNCKKHITGAAFKVADDYYCGNCFINEN